jgi:hypothetical protein
VTVGYLIVLLSIGLCGVFAGILLRNKIKNPIAIVSTLVCITGFYVFFSHIFVSATAVAYRDAPSVFIPIFFLSGGELADDISSAPSRVDFVNEYGPDFLRDKLPGSDNFTVNLYLTQFLLACVAFTGMLFLAPVIARFVLRINHSGGTKPGPGPELPKVFISYSSRDTKFVNWLITRLKQEGLTVWVDVQQVAVGDSIVARVNEGLESASYFIPVLSKSSVQSAWVQQEMDYAIIREKTQTPLSILPVVIDDCNLPPLLVGRKFADCRTDRNQGLIELLAVLNREREFFNSDFSDFSRATNRSSQVSSLASLGRSLLQLSSHQLNDLAQELGISKSNTEGKPWAPNEIVDEILLNVQNRRGLSELRDLLAVELPESLPKNVRPLAARLTEDIKTSGLILEDFIFMRSLSEQLRSVNSKRWRLLRLNTAYDFNKLKEACDKADSKLFEADQALGEYQVLLFLQAIYLFAVRWVEVTESSMTNDDFFVELIDELARSVIRLPSPIDSSNVATFLSHCKAQNFDQALRCVGVDPSLFENP